MLAMTNSMIPRAFNPIPKVKEALLLSPAKVPPRMDPNMGKCVISKCMWAWSIMFIVYYKGHLISPSNYDAGHKTKKDA